MIFLRIFVSTNIALMRFLGIFFISICLFSHLPAQNKETGNQVDKNGKKQGYWKRKDANNKLAYEGRFVNDIAQGVFKYYYEDGVTVKAISVFSDSGKVTRTQLFSENGQKMGEGKYINQKKDSVWKYYTEEGILLSEENYTKGKKNGSFKTYYKDGTVAEEVTWKNNIEEGLWQQYYDNKQLKIKGNYRNGFLDGKVAAYHLNGKLKTEGTYRDAVKDSTWNYYKETGELDFTEKYALGVLKEGGKEDLMTPEEFEQLKKDYEKENEELNKKEGPK
jgi:antitoxin component YwqK of YwqJK toxin-antitoxin module